jgi:hypothetical protein
MLIGRFRTRIVQIVLFSETPRDRRREGGRNKGGEERERGVADKWSALQVLGMQNLHEVEYEGFMDRLSTPTFRL